MWETAAQAVAASERERCAALLDAEHEQRKHLDNHAAYFARMIRERNSDSPEQPVENEMALEQIQIDGDAARVEVRKVWPAATSTYVSATAAEVYDAATGVVLGRVECSEFSVERAWVEAARSTQKSE